LSLILKFPFLTPIWVFTQYYLGKHPICQEFN